MLCCWSKWSTATWNGYPISEVLLLQAVWYCVVKYRYHGRRVDAHFDLRVGPGHHPDRYQPDRRRLRLHRSASSTHTLQWHFRRSQATRELLLSRRNSTTSLRTYWATCVRLTPFTYYVSTSCSWSVHANKFLKKKPDRSCLLYRPTGKHSFMYQVYCVQS